MASGSAPASAYVLEVTKETLEALNVEYDQQRLVIEQVENFVDENDGEITVKVAVNNKTILADIFYYNPEMGDIYDDLSEGYYISFNEYDLYERKLSPVGEAMEKANQLPELKHWTVFG